MAADDAPQPPAFFPACSCQLICCALPCDILESVLADMTPPVLNPFASGSDRDTDREHGQAVDVSADAMTRMRTPFVSRDTDRSTADKTDRQ